MTFRSGAVAFGLAAILALGVSGSGIAFAKDNKTSGGSTGKPGGGATSVGERSTSRQRLDNSAPATVTRGMGSVGQVSEKKGKKEKKPEREEAPKTEEAPK